MNIKKNLFGIVLALCSGFVMTACSDDDDSVGGIVERTDDQPVAMVKSEGFYVLNEGWLGYSMGSVNYYANSGDIKYRLYKEANPSDELGNTASFGTVWGNHVFFVSKQGNRLVVADEQMKKKAVFNQELGGDGSMFMGVDDKKGYVSTTAGIMKFDIVNMKFTGAIDGVSGLVGNMCLAEGKVFAVSSNHLYVIDAKTDQVLNTYNGVFHSVVLSKDGTVWVATDKGLQKYDVETGKPEDEEIVYPAGMEFYDSWGAWNANSLCASTQENVLYWMTGIKSSWFTTLRKIVKYEIDSNKFAVIKEIGKSVNDVQLSYCGAGIRVNPATNELIAVAVQDGWGENYMFNWVYKLDKDGKELQVYEPLGGDGAVNSNPQDRYYWFLTLPFFEDANKPQILLNQVMLKVGETKEIDLEEKVIDYDNIFASMIFELTPVEGSLVEVALDGDDLKVKAGSHTGVAACRLAVISNGVRVEKNIEIVVVE